MDIKSLSIRNCLTIGQADMELDNRGLLLVQGENLDDTSAKSNGAGKSSILDSLCWCLYGTTARDVTGDDVVNETAKKDCSVTVVLDDDGVQYKIERFRKHKIHKNQLFAWQLDGASPIDLSKGTDKETQIVVEKIMGCSLEVFVGAIYAGQEKMPDLPGMTDKQLKLIVEEAAGVEELAEAYTEARQRSLRVEGEMKVAEANLNSTESAKSGAQLELDMREVERQGFEDGRKDRARAELVKVKPLDEAAADAKAKIASYDEPVLLARKGVIETELGAHKAQQVKLAAVNAAERSLANRVTSAGATLKADKGRLDAQKAALADIDSQIGKPCGECGKAYCEHDLETAKVARTASIATATAALRETAAKYKELNAEWGVATVGRDAFALTMTDVSAVAAELAGINANLRSLEAFRADIAGTETGKARVIADAKVKLTEPNPYIKAVEAKKTQIEGLAKEIIDRKVAHEALVEQAELYADAVKVFGPAGVRAHILDTVTPLLNEKTGEYLGALADGNIHASWSTLAKTAKGDLKEKFNIDVTNDKGGKTFKALSGGEKRKVRLSAAMALQDMVASRATKPLNIFLADEIDHALDEPGLERLMTVLDRKAKERGTVIVVSHQSLSDWIDSVITVTKDGGVSTVTGATHRGF